MLYDNGPLATERQANAAKGLGSFASILVLAIGQVETALAEGFSRPLDALNALVEHWVLAEAHTASLTLAGA